jgi:hypothetical protein
MVHMTEAQIKHMVDRFLGWHLPENFNPDAEISFKRLHHPNRDVLGDDGRVVGARKYPMPSGTNLFDATQADAMVRYMIEGMPSFSTADGTENDV